MNKRAIAAAVGFAVKRLSLAVRFPSASPKALRRGSVNSKRFGEIGVNVDLALLHERDLTHGAR
jgi:hypothetical protein